MKSLECGTFCNLYLQVVLTVRYRHVALLDVRNKRCHCETARMRLRNYYDTFLCTHNTVSYRLLFQMAFQELKASLVCTYQDLLDQKGLLDQRDLQDLKDLQVSTDYQDQQDLQVLLDLRVHQDPEENLVVTVVLLVRFIFVGEGLHVHQRLNWFTQVI